MAEEGAADSSAVAGVKAALIEAYEVGEILADETDVMQALFEIESRPFEPALAPGQILVANPARFCSRNPFSRAVQDLERFGLSGPVSDDNMPPDMRASMLPVLALIEHGGSMPSSSAGGKSRALLLERRSGALMGDISMDECVPRNSPPRNSAQCAPQF